jgi:hypothetical protein
MTSYSSQWDTFTRKLLFPNSFGYRNGRIFALGFSHFSDYWNAVSSQASFEKQTTD